MLYFVVSPAEMAGTKFTGEAIANGYVVGYSDGHGYDTGSALSNMTSSVDVGFSRFRGVLGNGLTIFDVVLLIKSWVIAYGRYSLK